MTSEEHAIALIGYFERCATEAPDEKIWQLGVEAAREWLRLINTMPVSQAEVSALMDVVDKHKSEASGWFDLALVISHWAKLKGFSVPHPFWPHKSTNSG
jgi:hypothetical protein